jgi:hypothetical protein
MAKHDSPAPRPAQDPERFKHLPAPVDPKDLVTTQETEPPPDPEGGRNTDTDFLLRYGIGGG